MTGLGKMSIAPKSLDSAAHQTVSQRYRVPKGHIESLKRLCRSPAQGRAASGTSAAALARLPPGRPSPLVFRPERESVARIRAKADRLGSAERCRSGPTRAGARYR